MKIEIISLLSILCLLSACSSQETPVPKPLGYFRIGLQEKSYDTARINQPVIFEYPSNVARIEYHKGSNDFDIAYPAYNARIYCTYKPVEGNFYELSEDNRRFAYEHVVKADYIHEEVYENPEDNVYGILYTISGDAASQTQFMLTDSTHHFFRGSLYFNNRPNYDSIAPVAAYITEDIVRIMESASWK